MAAPYGIKVGQKWTSADGAGHVIEIVDVTTHADVNDAIVRRIDGFEYRLDFWKLAKVRYELLEDVKND